MALRRRKLSAFISKIVAWWTSRSTAASVMAGSGKTLFHSPKGWFAVIRTDRRSYHLPVELRNSCIQGLDLFQIHLAQLANLGRQRGVTIPDRVREPLEMGRPSGRDQAMLCKMPTQGVDHLNALANENLPCAKQHRAGLLIFRLHGDKTHGRTQR